MTDYILGLDIGTTTVSWSVLERDSLKQVEAANKQNNSFIETAIQDPVIILNICLDIVDDVKKRFKNIRAIGLTGQMHGIVILDRNGNSISPLYTWQYQASPELCNEVTAVSGKKAYSGYGLVTLYSLLKQDKIPKEAYSFCSIMDFVAMKLCHKTEPVLHSSVAASFGLFNLETCSFDTKSINKLGLNVAIIPQVTDKSIELGKNGDSSVFVAIGDNQASFLGVVSDDSNTICVNCGTGSQVSAAVEDWKGHKCQEVRPYIDGKFLLTGSALCGGRSYAILEQFFRAFANAAGLENKSVYSVMDKLAASSAETDLVVDTRFCGTRDNSQIKGAITNITDLNFTPQNLVRAFLTGMNQELFDFYEDMNLEGIKQISVSGNAIRKNPSFVKIIADKFKMKVELPEINEEAAFGACLFAVKHC